MGWNDLCIPQIQRLHQWSLGIDTWFHTFCNGCNYLSMVALTHWGRATHICVGKLTISGSDTGLSPGRCQAIIWINAGILLIGSLGTNFSENLIGTQTFSFKEMHLNMSSAKWRPSYLGLNVLNGSMLVKGGFAGATIHLNHIWLRTDGIFKHTSGWIWIRIHFSRKCILCFLCQMSATSFRPYHVLMPSSFILFLFQTIRMQSNRVSQALNVG